MTRITAELELDTIGESMREKSEQNFGENLSE